MVDLRDTEYYKKELAKEKLIVYFTLKNRSRNIYKSREAIENEVNNEMLLKLDEFLKDFEPHQILEIVDRCIEYTSSHFSPESNLLVKELNNKLINFYSDNRPSISMIKTKQKVLSLLQNAIDKYHEGAKFYKYGSSANGLESDSSDLDLTLIFPTQFKCSTISILFELQVFLKNHLAKNVLKSTNIIRSKKPILVLKLKSNSLNIEVDISIQNHKTVYNSYVIAQYSKIDERFPIIAFLIRQWAKVNSIFGGNIKRFNSYSLALLVIQYLQSGTSPPVLPYLNEQYPELFLNNPDVVNLDVNKNLSVEFARNNSMSIVELIAGFMEYYRFFEFEKYRPSILDSKFANRFNRSRYYQDNAINMVDPIAGENPCRNVSFVTLIQFREAISIFKSIGRADNNNLIEEFEIVFGLSNSSKLSDTLIAQSHFRWLLIW